MFAPGDIVECVDASPGRGWYPVTLKLGALYTVSAVYQAPDSRGRFGVQVLECPSLNPGPTGDCGYADTRFRRIYRPDPKLIELLSTAPAMVDARSPEVVF